MHGGFFKQSYRLTKTEYVSSTIVFPENFSKSFRIAIFQTTPAGAVSEVNFQFFWFYLRKLDSSNSYYKNLKVFMILMSWHCLQANFNPLSSGFHQNAKHT